MDPTSDVGLNPHPPSPPTRSHMITHNLKSFLSKRNILHPEKTYTEQEHEAEERARADSAEAMDEVEHARRRSVSPRKHTGPGKRTETRKRTEPRKAHIGRLKRILSCGTKK
jgi:hypothetical protein